MMGKEIWKWIPNLEGQYSASSFGRIKSSARCIEKNDSTFMTLKERILIPATHKGGYLKVCIAGSTRLVHHLVLEAFIGPCPKGMETRHINGNPSDNRIANIRWGTKADNERDKKLHGTFCGGERHQSHKLTADDIIEIRKKAASGLTRRELGEIYNVTNQTITQIVLRQTWKHVRGEYRLQASYDEQAFEYYSLDYNNVKHWGLTGLEAESRAMEANRIIREHSAKNPAACRGEHLDYQDDWQMYRELAVGL